jgi:hemin uptake protein HemP
MQRFKQTSLPLPLRFLKHNSALIALRGSQAGKLSIEPQHDSFMLPEPSMKVRTTPTAEAGMTAINHAVQVVTSQNSNHSLCATWILQKGIQMPWKGKRVPKIMYTQKAEPSEWWGWIAEGGRLLILCLHVTRKTSSHHHIMLPLCW